MNCSSALGAAVVTPISTGIESGVLRVLLLPAVVETASGTGFCYKIAHDSCLRRVVPGEGSVTSKPKVTWVLGGVLGVAWVTGRQTAPAHGSAGRGLRGAALVVAMPTWTTSAVLLRAGEESESQTWTAGRPGVVAASASFLMSKSATSD